MAYSLQLTAHGLQLKACRSLPSESRVKIQIDPHAPRRANPPGDVGAEQPLEQRAADAGAGERPPRVRPVVAAPRPSEVAEEHRLEDAARQRELAAPQPEGVAH